MADPRNVDRSTPMCGMMAVVRHRSEEWAVMLKAGWVTAFVRGEFAAMRWMGGAR